MVAIKSSHDIFSDYLGLVRRQLVNSPITIKHCSSNKIQGCAIFQLFNDHFTACFLEELWNLPATSFAFLSDVSLLEDAAQYPSCDTGSVGRVALRDDRLNTATVAYYNDTTTGSRACFVCNNINGYALNTTTSERVCQSDGTWSGSPIICGTLQICDVLSHITVQVSTSIFKNLFIIC